MKTQHTKFTRNRMRVNSIKNSKGISMKILLLNFLSFIIMMNLPCLLADEAPYKSSALLANGVGSLEFERLSGEDGLRRLILTHPGDKEVVVWESRQTPDYMIDDPPQRPVDPYVGAKLVGADQKDEVLLVLLRLDSKNNGLFGVRPKYSEHTLQDALQYKKEWDGFDYLLRSFVRQKDGSWGVYISAYLGTFWPDAVNEEVAGISIKDKNSYIIKYKGTLEAYDTYGFNRDNLKQFGFQLSGKFKVVHPEGFTEKRLVYDEKDRLLFTLGDNKEDRTYMDGSVWWYAFDEFSRSYYVPTNSLVVPTNFHVVMQIHEERCKELKIEPKKFFYLRKGTKEELERHRAHP